MLESDQENRISRIRQKRKIKSVGPQDKVLWMELVCIVVGNLCDT